MKLGENERIRFTGKKKGRKAKSGNTQGHTTEVILLKALWSCTNVGQLYSPNQH